MDLLPIRLGMKYCSIWVSSLWIYTYFEQYFMPGRIRPVEFDRARNTAQNELKFMDLLPIRLGMKYCSIWVSSLWIYTYFEQYFMPGRIRPVEFDRARNTAQNELKFMDLHPGRTGYHPNEFTPILSNISCLVEFDRSNSTRQEILLKMS